MSDPKTPWWLGAKYRVYLDFHMDDLRDQAPSKGEPSFQDLDVDPLVDQFAAAGVDALIFYAKDNRGNSYYPTTIGHQLSDLNGRDVVGEFVEALHRRSMKAIAYFQPIRDHRAFAEHPDWRQVNNDGSDRVWNGHELVCPLGPAGEAAFEQLDELAARYPIDGVWWDRVGDVQGTADQFACFCESCRRQFREATGLEIPRVAAWHDPVWRTFWNWRAEKLLQFQQRACDILHKRRPDAALIGNYVFFGMALDHPWPQSTDMEAIADATDVVAFECQHFRSFLHMSSHPAFIKALTDRPADLLIYDMQVIADGIIRSRPANEAMTHSILARGHAVTLLDTVVPYGLVDRKFVELTSAIFHRAKRMDDAMTGAQPLRYAAILFSPRTFREYGRAKPDDYVQEFMGTLRLLVEAHVPMEVISDRHLTTEHLSHYAVLVLPDAACLTDGALDAIRAWVEPGGILLATHEVSRRTIDGEERADFALGDLLGVTYAGPGQRRRYWMRALPGAIADQGWEDSPVSLTAGTTLVTATAGTEVLAELGEPHPSVGAPPGRNWGPHAAITLRRVGKGAAIYVAGRLGKATLELGTPEYAAPLEAALRLAPTPPVRSNGPTSLELICRERSDGGWLLHLINMPGETSRGHWMPGIVPRMMGVREIWPLADITVEVARPVRAARELLDGQPLTVEHTEAGSRIHFPRLSSTAAVAIDF